MDTDQKQMPAQMDADIQPRAGYKRCLNCGKVITPGAGQRREYCNAACKQAAWRKRKEAASVTA
jgi:hypothetical protein